MSPQNIRSMSGRGLSSLLLFAMITTIPIYSASPCGKGKTKDGPRFSANELILTVELGTVRIGLPPVSRQAKITFIEEGTKEPRVVEDFYFKGQNPFREPIRTNTPLHFRDDVEAGIYTYFFRGKYYQIEVREYGRDHAVLRIVDQGLRALISLEPGTDHLIFTKECLDQDLELDVGGTKIAIDFPENEQSISIPLASMPSNTFVISVVVPPGLPPCPKCLEVVGGEEADVIIEPPPGH